MFKTFEEMDVTHQAAYKLGYYDGLREINRLIERSNTRFNKKLIIDGEYSEDQDVD